MLNGEILNVFLLLLSLVCGKAFADVEVELDVVFSDSVQCRYLYVFRPGTEGLNDTLAVFDTLSFNGQNRVSLFYSVDSCGKNMLALVDSGGMQVESNLFGISPWRTTFSVLVGQQQIKVNNKDYLYPQKNEDERSYFIFLFIFFVVKIIITAVYVFSSKLPKRLIPIASGAFLLTAFVDWFLPVHYLYRFLMMALAEYILIAVVARKSISWLRAAVLVLMVNIAGFGLIAILYLGFVFW